MPFPIPQGDARGAAEIVAPEPHVSVTLPEADVQSLVVRGPKEHIVALPGAADNPDHERKRPRIDAQGVGVGMGKDTAARPIDRTIDHPSCVVSPTDEGEVTGFVTGHERRFAVQR